MDFLKIEVVCFTLALLRAHNSNSFVWYKFICLKTTLMTVGTTNYQQTLYASKNDNIISFLVPVASFKINKQTSVTYFTPDILKNTNAGFIW